MTNPTLRALAAVASLLTTLSACRPESTQPESTQPESAQAPSARAPSLDPAGARLITEDIPRFWAAFDAAIATDEATLADALQRGYLDPGSPGVAAFVPYRIVDANNLARTVLANRAHYEAQRAKTLAVGELEQSIRAAFVELERLYPEAVFPDVYFIIGALNSGGTSAPTGLSIGMEMEVNSPSRTPLMVAHELIHYQQQTSYEDPTLLEQSLYEGIADFVGELISGALTEPERYAWANPRERELWTEFRAVMDERDFGTWLYVRDQARLAGRPPDLGYWMGYRIAAHAYARAQDKRVALRELFLMQDAQAFLAHSGYAEQFEAGGAP